MFLESRRLAVYFLIFVFIFFTFNRLLFFRPGFLEKLSSYIIYSLIYTQDKFFSPVKIFLTKKRNAKELECLLRKTVLEKEELLAENIKLKSILNFKNETKEIIDFAERYNYSYQKIAGIILKNINEQVHFVLIDKGRDAGIQKDMVAIYKNCLIGRVIEVYPRYSKVLLITDKSCKVAVYCSETKTMGIHEGRNKKKETSLKHVPHYAKLKGKELLISSGDGLVFPKGFALGRIKNFINNDINYLVTIEPLIDIDKINYCYIIRK